MTRARNGLGALRKSANRGKLCRSAALSSLETNAVIASSTPWPPLRPRCVSLCPAPARLARGHFRYVRCLAQRYIQVISRNFLQTSGGLQNAYPGQAQIENHLTSPISSHLIGWAGAERQIA